MIISRVFIGCFPGQQVWPLPQAEDDELDDFASAEDDEVFRHERLMVERLTPICTFRHLTKLLLTRVVQKRQGGKNYDYCEHIFQVPTLEELVLDDCQYLGWALGISSAWCQVLLGCAS